ncbi:unannotated protein [freshwater metagenome]|uniref:Unannotated protein n=1 Tax=freshwater metagenome TaxID=449393 RepID=A0A6J6I8N9_9ZZZZ
MCRTTKKASTVRRAMEPTMIQRRPPRIRSMAGPMSGAAIANGAIVSTRYSATRQRAELKSREKKTDPARPMAKSASPATDAACTRASRENGEGTHGRVGSRSADGDGLTGTMLRGRPDTQVVTGGRTISYL